jgi:hypothetical protein
MKDKYFGAHEFQARKEDIKTSSDRNFGLVFAGFFALLGALSIYHGGTRWYYWFPLAALFGVLAYIAPGVLAVVLGILFYICISPIGFLMRLTGKDPLRRKFEPAAKSYWIVRAPPGPAPKTFKNQF